MVGIALVLSPAGPGLWDEAVVAGGGAGVLLFSTRDLLRVWRPSLWAVDLRLGVTGASSSSSSSSLSSASLLLWLLELTFISIPLSASLSADDVDVRLLRLVAVFRWDSMSVSDSDSSDVIASLLPVHADDVWVSGLGCTIDWRVLAMRDLRGVDHSELASSYSAAGGGATPCDVGRCSEVEVALTIAESRSWTVFVVRFSCFI